MATDRESGWTPSIRDRALTSGFSPRGACLEGSRFRPLRSTDRPANGSLTGYDTNTFDLLRRTSKMR
jgi:hypothetical protein